jgi:hypothetical protein
MTDTQTASKEAILPKMPCPSASGVVVLTTDSQQSVVPEPGEIPQAFSKMLKGYCGNHR